MDLFSRFKLPHCPLLRIEIDLNRGGSALEDNGGTFGQSALVHLEDP